MIKYETKLDMFGNIVWADENCTIPVIEIIVEE